MYRRYTQDQLANALAAIRSKIMGLKAATRTFGVAIQTIGDRISARIPGRATSGPDKCRSEEALHVYTHGVQNRMSY